VKIWTSAELDLHNAITYAVEARTGVAWLAASVADDVVEEALTPTPALLRHMADWFDRDDSPETHAKVGANLVRISSVLRDAAKSLESAAAWTD